jgi:hypothetical protein
MIVKTRVTETVTVRNLTRIAARQGMMRQRQGR